MPDENIPYDATVFTICGVYYQLKDFKTANKLAKKLFDIFEGDLRVYNSQESNRKMAYGRDMGQAKEILKRLTGLAEQFKQDSLSKDFMKRISNVMTAEDLEPPAEETQP